MYDLSLKNTLSESAVFASAGVGETYKQRLRQHILSVHENTCKGCGIMQNQYLHLHLEVPTEVFPYETFMSKMKGFAMNTVSKQMLENYCVILCEACHRTQHVEQVFKLGLGRIVICPFTQLQLFKMCRNNLFYKNDLFYKELYIKEDIFGHNTYVSASNARHLFDEVTYRSANAFTFLKREKLFGSHDDEDSLEIDNKIIDRRFANIYDYGGWKILYNADFNWNHCSGQDRLDTYNNLKKLKGGKLNRKDED